jgi:glutamate 5-kinase
MENDLQTSSRWMILQEENMNSSIREILKDKKRIVIKIGSSSLTHPKTGALNLTKLEVLVREISDLHNMGKDVIVVSSGAIAVGRRAAGLGHRPSETKEKQACAAIGQARLMMIYQKLFSEYNQLAAQILMTKRTVMDNLSRFNALNTFRELLKLGAIPIVNENDTVSTYEMQFGDNDTLSAIVAALIDADLLLLLSDIDGLFTDDPNSNPNAELIHVVEKLDDHLLKMGKSTSTSDVGTGGMASKLTAAKLASAAGTDMVIANGEDFRNIHRVIEGQDCGTLFLSHKKDEFYLMDYLEKML